MIVVVDIRPDQPLLPPAAAGDASAGLLPFMDAMPLFMEAVFTFMKAMLKLMESMPRFVEPFWRLPDMATELPVGGCDASTSSCGADIESVLTLKGCSADSVRVCQKGGRGEGEGRKGTFPVYEHPLSARRTVFVSSSMAG
eukprot:3932319-Rhodomonas_salina.1